MGISRVTRNCQVTLSKDIRKLVNIKEGDDVLLTVEDGSIKISKMEKDPVMAAAGIWKGMKETGVEYERRIRKGWRKRLAREYASS